MALELEMFRSSNKGVYNSLLPYSSSLHLEAANYLKKIKAYLGQCILTSAHRIDIGELKTYVQLYGYCFTKEDHILFIKLFLNIMQIPGIEMSSLSGLVHILNYLLRKQRLISPKELTIEWRPLYDIYCNYILERKNLFQVGQSYGFESSLRNFIEIARNYFAPEATQEILDELRPVSCPFTSCKIFRYAFLLGLFLPTQMFPEHHEKGYKLWFDEILGLWSGPNCLQCENIFFKLLSRLATHNIGYIDWSPYMSTIFTKCSKAMNNSSGSQTYMISITNDCSPLVEWIVSIMGGPNSPALSYIEALFKAVESNFHPSNMSRCSSQLTNILSKLSSAFINRLYKERYLKKTWQFRPPPEYRITEEEIDKFVDILQPLLYTGMFCRFGAQNIFNTIRDLAWLRPEKVIPPLLEMLYIALDSNLEAHRLNSLMIVLAMVASVMINGLGRYEEGKSHLISLLFGCLPGLDCNDIKKCGNTCGLIYHLIESVPIMDCSLMVDIRDDLTEVEYNIALETARFEEFVLIFVEKVLTLTENYASELRPEKIDNDPVKQSSEESYFESSLITALQKILSHSSPQIFEKALDKLYNFLRGRIFESRSTIRMMTHVAGIFARAYPRTVIEKFLPYLHSTILGLTDNDDVFEDDVVDAQLILALHTTAEILIDGSCLIDYSEKICDIIRRGLKLKPSYGYKPVTGLLSCCFESLTNVYPKSPRSLSLSWEQLSDFKNTNPIRLWGQPEKPEDVKLDWNVPSERAIELARKMMDEFLISQVTKLSDWTCRKLDLTREEVHRSLSIILFCVAGPSRALDPFDCEEYVFLDVSVAPIHERVHEIGTKTLTLSSGENPRQVVAQSARTFLKYINENCSDDTKSLDLIIKIYQVVLGWAPVPLKPIRDDHCVIKKSLRVQLLPDKKLPRRIIVERMRMQHEYRILAKSNGKFTTLHRDLVLDLISLAFSHYADVRAKAHGALLLFKHPFGYRLLATELTKVFNKPRTAGETEEIQGALSILINHYSCAFTSISDWECVVPLWLSLVNTTYCEKPAIIALLEQLTKLASSKLQPLLIEFNFSPELVAIGRKFFGSLTDVQPPDESAIAKGAELCVKNNQKNHDLYLYFVHKLVESIESGQLHWRHLQFAFLLLQSLIRKDIKFPVEGTRIVVKNLINDHIFIRRICINGVAAILKQHKPEVTFQYEPVTLNSDQSNNYDWLYFKPEINYNDEHIWKQTKWVNQTFISPIHASKEGIKYYTETSAFPSRHLDSVSPQEAVILEFFLDKSKVTKLLDFITVDDKKPSLLGPRRYKMFQGLFRNFGVTLIDFYRDFFENLNSESKENVHKCVCDVLTGLVRGSKFWPYQDMVTLRGLLEPTLKKVSKIISRETSDTYFEFCIFGFRRLDGRRYSWLFNYLIEDPLNSSDTTVTAFQSYSRLKMLCDLLVGQCWRAMPYSRRLFDYILQNHLKNQYQNIRQLIGCSLTQLLQYDHDFFHKKPLAFAPKIDELLTIVVPELESAALNVHLQPTGFFSPESTETSSTSSSSASSPMVVVDSSGNSIEDLEKESSNLLTTLCYWLHPHLSLNPYIIRPLILQLVPSICEIQNRSKDDELLSIANEALNAIGQCSIKEKFIDTALDVCKKMTESKSWHTRVSGVSFVQLIVSSNLFTLKHDHKHNKTICDMITDLIQDNRIEVRERAASLLGGLFHYQFIEVDRQLINKFKAKCARKLTRNKETNCYDINELNEKHGGALGLCSIVSAYPYDVPEFLPDILMFLSDHLHDTQPIPTTIRKTLSDFKRTHYDNWRQHKEKFNEDQLSIITDLLVSPNYYA